MLPSIRFVVQLYRDKHFLKDTVASWGWVAPLVFIGIQALQVIISPIPGEITGPGRRRAVRHHVGHALLDDRPHHRHAVLLRAGPACGGSP